jgi:Ca-activated chloride channel family protein
VVSVALAGMVQFVLAGCTGSPSPGSYSGPSFTLRILASSELADMTPILDQAASATGVTVKLTPVGSLAGAQQVIDGTAERYYDAVWFASDNYLDLYPEGLAKLNGTTEIMSTPVILGMRTSAADRLGWNRNPVTWAEIAEAAARSEFTFGMTDPSLSNSGLSALVAVATAIAGNGAALQASEIAEAEPELAGMFRQQKLTARSSGELTQAYLHELADGQAPDGLVDYESQLLTLQAEAPRDNPITLIYPSDGVLDATYPLSLLTSAPPAARNAYQRLARYLTTSQVQREIMQVTHRRPITGGIPLAGALAGHQPFQLPFPAAAATIQNLIGTYDGMLRRTDPATYGPIGFEPNTTVFRDPADASAALTELAGYLKADLSAKIELTGTTARWGSPPWDLKLSMERAEAVKAALMRLGASPGQIETRGLGWHFPGYGNDQGPDGTLLPGPAEHNRSVIVTELTP